MSDEKIAIQYKLFKLFTVYCLLLLVTFNNNFYCLLDTDYYIYVARYILFT